MALLPINFHSVQAASDFPVYPPGVFTLKVTSVTQETAKSSGEPKLSVRLEIIDGPDGDTQYAGETMFRSYSLQQKAERFLKRFLDACGITAESVGPEGELDDQALVGAEFRATVTVRQYNGRDTNDIGGETAVDTGGNGHTEAAPAPAAPSMLRRPPVTAARTAPVAARPVAPAPPPAAPPRQPVRR